MAEKNEPKEGERSEPRPRTAPEGSLPTERGQTVPA